MYFQNYLSEKKIFVTFSLHKSYFLLCLLVSSGMNKGSYIVFKHQRVPEIRVLFFIFQNQKWQILQYLYMFV